MECLLCRSPHSAAFKVEKKPSHSYFHCAACDLIFMNPAERLGPAEEKTRYDLHDNQSSAGYNAFLEPLVKDLDDQFHAAKLNPRQLTMLDFGCGPTLTLSEMFAAKGYQTAQYDIYYRPDQEQLRKTYHFVTSTEVWEHFYHPREEIERLVRLVKGGGLLGVMTSGHKGEAVFHDWHYRRDDTHVCFYSERTMNWIAEKFRLRLMKAQSPYWIFQKVF